MPNFKISKQGQLLLKHLGDKVDIEELQEYAAKNFQIGGSLIHAYLVDKVEGHLNLK